MEVKKQKAGRPVGSKSRTVNTTEPIKVLRIERIVTYITYRHLNRVPQGYKSTHDFIKLLKKKFGKTPQNREIDSHYIHALCCNKHLPYEWGGNKLLVVKVEGKFYIKISWAIRKNKKREKKVEVVTKPKVIYSKGESFIVEEDTNYDPNIDLDQE